MPRTRRGSSTTSRTRPPPTRRRWWSTTTRPPGPTWVLGQFQQFFILPQHIWAQHTGSKGADLKTFPNNAPVVGSGPFTLVKFKKNNVAIFQRNDSYWGTKPKIDEFGLQQFSDDDAMVTALKAHDLDAIEPCPRRR